MIHVVRIMVIGNVNWLSCHKECRHPLIFCELVNVGLGERKMKCLQEVEPVKVEKDVDGLRIFHG